MPGGGGGCSASGPASFVEPASALPLVPPESSGVDASVAESAGVLGVGGVVPRAGVGRASFSSNVRARVGRRERGVSGFGRAGESCAGQSRRAGTLQEVHARISAIGPVHT